MYPHLIVHNVPVCNIKAAKMYPHCGFRSLILISEQKVLGNCVLFILSDSTFVKSDTFFISASLAKVSRAQFDIAAAAVKLLGFSDICPAMWAAAVPPIVFVVIIQWPGLLYWNAAPPICGSPTMVCSPPPLFVTVTLHLV